MLISNKARGIKGNNLCLIDGCPNDFIKIDLYPHTTAYLCEEHYEYASGYFERASGGHIFEYNDVVNWIENGCEFVEKSCYKTTGYIYGCVLPLGHEGFCAVPGDAEPKFKNLQRLQKQFDAEKKGIIIEEEPKLSNEEYWAKRELPNIICDNVEELEAKCEDLFDDRGNFKCL